MIPDDKKLSEILLKNAYVAEEDIKRAENFAKANRSSVIEYLESKGLITKNLLGQAIAESFGVNYADLNTSPPPRDLVLKLDESVAKKNRAVLFKENEGELIVATDDPAQKNLAEKIEKAVFAKKTAGARPAKITIAYSLPENIDTALSNYRKALETRFAKIIRAKKSVAPEILEEILEDAFVYGASDIHLEPQEKEVVIRFRVDGVMHEAGRIPKEYYEGILNRVKIQARMRIDEHNSSQDGAIRHQGKNNASDLRVSIAPILDGEKIEIRVLAEYLKGFTLSDLGLSSQDQASFEEAARKPFGMILVAGPTGSGKTTTLYALIRLLNREEVNITTIEDPVEYKITGVNQIQVNPQTNLTFADGLRSIVRQDPDIILVGEIRDRETADIAANAALTGHLLLSTLHANDAATAVPRLLDMEVEPFLLSSTLELIVSQRLVRKICVACRESREVSVAELEKIFPGAADYFPKQPFNVYSGKGCSVCGGTSYKGRTAIFEIIRVSAEMRELILENPTTQQIWQLAKKGGSRSLFEDGVEKVKNGVTTLEELLRVARPPEEERGGRSAETPKAASGKKLIRKLSNKK